MKWISIFFWGCSVTWVQAQPAVQNFSLLNVADNRMISLDGYKSCAAVAVIFTSNACAYDDAYKARIRALVDQYKGKVQFLLVNAHLEKEESVDAMKAEHASWDISIPYLADKDQAVMGIFGAYRSPEVFLLRHEGGKYTQAYSGAIDDNPQVAADVKQQYLRMAIDQLLAGQPLGVRQVRPVGCTIRKK
jgi:metal-sulfur cluster biosynthetic enzyme